MAKTLSTGAGNYNMPDGGRKPSGTPWKKIIPMAAIAVVVTAAAIALPVRARGPAVAAGDTDPVQDVPAAAADTVASWDGQAESGQAGTTYSYGDAVSNQGAVDGIEPVYYEPPEDGGGDAGNAGLPVTEEPVDDGNVDEVALAAAAMEQGTGNTAQEPEPAPAATPEPEVQIVYVYIEKEPEPEPEPTEEIPVETEPVEQDPASVVPEDNSEMPDWLKPVTTPEPAPEWLVELIDRAMWYNPYDGGPLCQKSWAQIPCPVSPGTRAYVELDTPVIWLSQADLISFAGTAIRNCDADWFTIYGSDGYGLQFLSGSPDYAVYGPLDEYGQVTEVVRFIFLAEDGYYAVMPGPVD